MARCDEGYLCDVCGGEVESIVDSDLYLRYILGEVSPLALASIRERHVRCDPALAQYIVDDAFAPIECAGPFGKTWLAADYVAEQNERVTRAWRRLQELPTLGIPITEYPLPEVRAAWVNTQPQD